MEKLIKKGEITMDKKDFIKKCGELLSEAKPHLIKCEYKLGKEMPLNQFEKYLDEDEYVLITCENGHTYSLLISGNSLCATATTIFSEMSHK